MVCLGGPTNRKEGGCCRFWGLPLPHAAFSEASGEACTLSPEAHMSYSLNSLKGAHIGDYIVDCYRAY